MIKVKLNLTEVEANVLRELIERGANDLETYLENGHPDHEENSEAVRRLKDTLDRMPRLMQEYDEELKNGIRAVHPQNLTLTPVTFFMDTIMIRVEQSSAASLVGEAITLRDFLRMSRTSNGGSLYRTDSGELFCKRLDGTYIIGPEVATGENPA